MYPTIDLRQGIKLVDTGEPKGRFVCVYRASSGWVYEALDNAGDELVTKSFTSLKPALNWLHNQKTKALGRAYGAGPNHTEDD